MRAVTDYQQPVPIPTTDDRCDVCGEDIPSMGNYCPRCGTIKPSMRFSGLPSAGNRRIWAQSPTQYRSVARTDWRRIGKSISAFVMLTFVAQMVLAVIALLYGVKWVAPAILDEWHGFPLILILPVIIKFFTLSGYSLLVFYFFLIGAIVSSCAWVFATSVEGFSKELSMTAISRDHSPLFETCGLLFATLFFSLLVALLFRTSTSELSGEGTLQESLFQYANASVWEELMVRVLLIGLPLLFVDLLRRNHKYKWHSYLLGGGFKIGTAEAVLVFVSASIFGYAHYAGGWGAWKIIPASAAGLAFGYLFLRFGLAASILLHFATNYLGMPIEVFNNNGLTIITGLGILIWLGFGVIFFAYYVTRVFEFLTGQRMFEGGPTAVPTPWVDPRKQIPFQPPSEGPYGVAQTEQHQATATDQAPTQPSGFSGGYVCPRCGYTQARWVEGRFQCMRCGLST